MRRIKQRRAQKRPILAYRAWRPAVQWGFLVLVLMIGAQFALFVRQLERGQEPTLARPAGVEAFLPISALISLKYWLLTGVFNRIHPSGLVLLLVIGAVSLLLKKGFCSWVCPFGLFGEYLEKLHKRLLRRRLSLPCVLDYPMRGLKYLLLLFFLRAIFVRMDVVQLERFIDSPYNRVADVKMLKFFADPSATTVTAVAVLLGLSLAIPFFWCRYLCPYGALLGGMSVLSPFKIRRNSQVCTGCERCTRICPARIRVHEATRVLSDECHACLRCVDACPVNGALRLSAVGERISLSKPAYAVAVVLLFSSAVFAARVTGYWRNDISTAEYRAHIAHLNHPAYMHNRGTVPDYRWDELGIHDPARAAHHSGH
jgi:polyferredoxin